MDEVSVADAVRSVTTGSFQRRLLAVTGAVMCFGAVEILVISFVLPDLIETWRLSGFFAGLLGSASLIGMAGGTALGGWYADQRGRVTALKWSVVGYSASAVLTAFSVGFPSAFLLRFLTGLFVGVTVSSNVSYLTEHVPAKDRGRYIVYLDAFWPAGTLVTVAVAWFVLEVVAVGGQVAGIDSWRVLFVFAGFPALVTPILWRLTESPYYLAGSGRLDAANDRLESMAESNDRAEEFERATTGVDEESSSSFLRLFQADLRGKTVLTSFVWFGLNFGFYGVFTWLPTTLEVIQLPGSTYLQLFAVAAVQLPGVLSASLLVDRIGRRPTIGGYLLGSGVFMGLFADAIGESLFAGYVPVPPLASLFLASFFLIGAWGPSFVYTSELFPTRVRATGFGFASGVGKIASILGPVSVGLLVPFGYRVALLPFGVGLLAAGVAVLAVGPETKDTALA